MAEKKTVNIDVVINSEESVRKLKELRTALKQTAAGSEDFKRISQAIKDTEDSLEEAKVGAKGFVDQLEDAGGPVGALFQGLRKVEIATKSFGAALKATGIGLIVGLIGGFVAALSKSEETMKKFEPILIMFEQALNGILGALEPLIDGFIQLAMNVMPTITSVFKVAYSAVTALFQSLGKLGGAVVKLFKGDFKGAWEDAKASVTGFGENYDKAVTRFEAGTKKITKTQKENLKEQQKDRDEAEKERQRLEEERLKREEDAFKVQTEAYKARLGDRQRELYEAEEAYEERRKTLLRAGITDFAAIEEQKRIEQKKINDKYDKEDQEKAAERFKKFIDGLKDKKEREIKALEDSLSLEESRLKALQEGTAEFFNQQRVIEDAAYAVQKEKAKGNAKQLEAIEKNHKAVLRNIDNAELEAKRNLQLQIVELYGGFGRALQQLAGKNKKLAIAGLLIEQAAGIATIIINTQKAAAKAGFFTPLGIATLIAGAASVAAAIAATVKGIQQINKVETPAGEGGGAAAPSGNQNIALPTVAGVAAPQIQTGGGANPTAQIGETIAASQRPIRAYVVSGEVSTQQALDRRTSRAATFAGG